MRNIPASRLLVLAVLAAGLAACTSGSQDAPAAAPDGRPVAAASSSDAERRARLDEVMRSTSCAKCHPAIYAEHMENTHGLAFVDPEARLATREFRRENCVRCHTPRPIFETGLGMVPIERHHDLEEGNTCMSCHFKADYDYAEFKGGAECRVAFDDRVGDVQACATCHRVAGTPEQWERAPHGKLAGRTCVTCHMPLVERPVAVGEAPRMVRSHVFPASQSESQIRRAYSYDVAIEGSELVVRIGNKGAGHNFPTAAQQRSVESLVVVRDTDGKEVTRTRAVYKHPYADSTSRELPFTTQIPSGATREQRVPIHVAAGTIECELFFKTYYPIEDGHPRLSRRMERRVITFHDVPPSIKPVDVPPRVAAPVPAVSAAEARRPDRLAKFAHPVPGQRRVEIPEGDSDADIEQLVALLEFPVQLARVEAHRRILAIGDRAIPALVNGLGHWSDETFDQSMDLLTAMGDRAAPALRAALSDERLYVRLHARMVLTRMGFPGDRDELRATFLRDLARPHPVDRRSAADALGRLGDAAAAPQLRARLDDVDWDVVAAAAHALALLHDKAAAPAVNATLARATFVESRRDLASALCALGDPAGVPVLLTGLDHPDDVIRRTFFDAFFGATGLYMSYDPDAPRRDRLTAIAALRSYWLQHGGPGLLRPAVAPDEAAHEKAFALVEELGGGTDVKAGGDDVAILQQIVDMGGAAVPALIEGLTFPTGFTRKRALVCEALGKIGDPRAAPYMVRALRDPNLSVSAWACWALESTGDSAALPALHIYSRRLAAYRDGHPDNDTAAVDRLAARAAGTRLRLGDAAAAEELKHLGPAGADLSAALPARIEGMVRTTEAPPVAVPTSEADAIEKAQALRAQDYYEDAVRVLKVAEDRFGVSAALRLELAWNLLMIAEEDMTRDRDQDFIDAEVADARVRFDEAVRADPKIEGRELLEAKMLRYERREDEARKVLETYVAAHPEDAQAHQEMGYFSYVTKDWARAEHEYAELARLAPEDGWAWLYMALARQWLGHPVDELDEGYLKAATLLPEVRTPLRMIVKLHPADPGRALELLRRVVATQPRAIWARIHIAHVLRTETDPDLDGAEKVLREALTISPKDQAAHFNLGELLEQRGDPAAAAAEYVEAAASATIGDAGETADALDRLLLDDGLGDALSAEQRLAAWTTIVAKSPSVGRFAHDAARWYADVAHDPQTARRFFDAAAAAEPSNEIYSADAAHARSDPAMNR